MDRVSIVVQHRDVTGTRAAKRLRRSGLIPGVLYGHGSDAVLIAIEPHALRDALGTEAGMHAVLDVTVEGHKRGHKAIVKELELDRVKQTITHVDLQEIRLDRDHRIHRRRALRGRGARRQDGRPARRGRP